MRCLCRLSCVAVSSQEDDKGGGAALHLRGTDSSRGAAALPVFLEEPWTWIFSFGGFV